MSIHEIILPRVGDLTSPTDPEQPIFAPIMAFIGATEGFAESLWLVALLSLVDAEGKGYYTPGTTPRR